MTLLSLHLTGRVFTAPTLSWLNPCLVMPRWLKNLRPASIQHFLRDLFKKMVGESLLAGELGTLLRVEDGISAELRRAREHFVKKRQTTGYLPGMEPVEKQSVLDLSDIDDDHFFHDAEIRIIEALRVFADTATGSASVRRRLFAGDATQGVALIDLLRKNFDILLMNPPFG